MLVDEYQDTNALQGKIVDEMAKAHGNVMVVGDDAQCIYGFRGAAVENMREFAARWPTARTLPLQLNYRSSPSICALANASLEGARVDFPTRLRAVRTQGLLPAVVPCKDARVQAEFIAERVLQMRDEGVPLDEIAILYRAHKNAMEVQAEFARRGIPFVVRSGQRFFESAHIKDVLAHLKLVQNPDDELSFRRAIKLHDGVGSALADQLWQVFKAQLSTGLDAARALQSLSQAATLSTPRGKRGKGGVVRFTEVMARLGSDELRRAPAEQVRVLLEQSYREHLRRAYQNADERIAEVDQLADYASGFADTEAFLSELMLAQGMSAEEIISGDRHEERVCLSSVHQSKGLEWRCVFVIWLADGTFPSELSIRDGESDDEERRLFYVAVTRAKDELVLTYPQTTRMRDQTLVLVKPSRFVSELPVPEVDDDGTAIGLYEPWVLELEAPPTTGGTVPKALPDAL